MAIGIPAKPIYRIELPGGAWQLLWWLICEMDDKCMVRRGWRVRAARDMKHHRISVLHWVDMLHEKRLIDTHPYARGVRVNTGNITG